MNGTLIAQIVTSGLVTGLIYMLIALGVTLLFGIMRVVNFVHGELVMLSAFAIWYIGVDQGLPMWVAIPIAVAVAADEDERTEIMRNWADWACDVPIEVIVDDHRSLIRSVLHYVDSIEDEDAVVTVLISEIQPRKPYHEILHNQRGRLLAEVLRARTDVIVATLPFRLHD